MAPKNCRGQAVLELAMTILAISGIFFVLQNFAGKIRPSYAHAQLSKTKKSHRHYMQKMRSKNDEVDRYFEKLF